MKGNEKTCLVASCKPQLVASFGRVFNAILYAYYILTCVLVEMWVLNIAEKVLETQKSTNYEAILNDQTLTVL